MRKRTIWKYEKPKLRVKGKVTVSISVSVLPCLVVGYHIRAGIITRRVA